MVNLENLKPTETEKLLFHYYGLYLIKTDEWITEYAPVHVEKTSDIFPLTINNINEEMIEWNNSITFDSMSETVIIKSFYDLDAIVLIAQRMEELGFKKTFTLNI